MEQTKKAVLLVEDNVLLTNLYSAALKRKGLEVIIVHNGDEGLKAIEEHLPDVVLLDLNLPGITGVEVLERIRSNPQTKDLKVIVLTSSSKEEDEKRAENLGVYRYLKKTELHLDDIINEVISCLSC